MGPEEQLSWKDEALEFLLGAIAADNRLREILIFKGARILYQGLGVSGRQSLDLDATLRPGLEVESGPQDRAAQLEVSITQAIHRAIGKQDPVRYDLQRVAVALSPRDGHPRGWHGYSAIINLVDVRQRGTLGVPRLEIDIAAPESLSPEAVAELSIGAGHVLAYTVVRQTAEKLRAFLQSSAAWRMKLGSPDRPPRVKDLVDLVAVVRHHPLDDTAFWDEVAEEFGVACRERLVDCGGWETFNAMRDDSQATFAADVALQQLATFDSCWRTLEQVISALDERGIFPLENPLG